MDALFSVLYPSDSHYEKMEMLFLNVSATGVLGTIPIQLQTFSISNGKDGVTVRYCNLDNTT